MASSSSFNNLSPASQLVVAVLVLLLIGIVSIVVYGAVAKPCWWLEMLGQTLPAACNKAASGPPSSGPPSSGPPPPPQMGCCCNPNTGIGSQTSDAACTTSGYQWLTGDTDCTKCAALNPPGCCCDDATGVCTDSVHNFACTHTHTGTGHGNTWTAGVCAAPPPPPMGCCCNVQSGETSSAVTSAECTESKGNWTPGTCDPTSSCGCCCNTNDHTSAYTSQTGCSNSNTWTAGAGTCVASCPPAAVGCCCDTTDGTSTSGVTSGACTKGTGNQHIWNEGSSCTGLCGCCCDPDSGTSTYTSQATCPAGSNWTQGPCVAGACTAASGCCCNPKTGHAFAFSSEATCVANNSGYTWTPGSNSNCSTTCMQQPPPSGATMQFDTSSGTWTGTFTIVQGASQFTLYQGPVHSPSNLVANYNSTSWLSTNAAPAVGATLSTTGASGHTPVGLPIPAAFSTITIDGLNGSNTGDILSIE